jgi:hypothetical protein
MNFICFIFKKEMNNFDALEFYDKYDKFENCDKIKYKQKTKGKVYSTKHIRISQSKKTFV